MTPYPLFDAAEKEENAIDNEVSCCEYFPHHLPQNLAAAAV
jgi:hypothetical protein